MSTYKVSNLKIMPSSVPGEFFAQWTKFNSAKQEHISGFNVQWRYSILDAKGNNKWQNYESAPDEAKGASYSNNWSVPDNANLIQVRVRPKIKNTKKDSAKWVTYPKDKGYDPDQTSIPSKPGNVTLTIEDYQAKMSYINTDPVAVAIKFTLRELLTGNIIHTSPDWIEFNANGYAEEVSITVNPDNKYSASCVVKNAKGKTSEDSDIESAESEIAIPTTPTNLIVTSVSDNQIELSWDSSSPIAEEGGYEVEYAEKESWFGTNNASKVTSNINSTPISNLTAGKVYYFHVRAKNEQGKYSGYSNVVSSSLGIKPKDPTTWSLPDNKVMIGESVKLYWTHNSVDNSKPTNSQIRYYINDELQPIINVPNTSDSNDVYTFNYILEIGSDFSDSDIVKWQVRTKGIDFDANPDKNYSDWSVLRTIDIYAPIQIATDYPQIVNEYPIDIQVLCFPESQTPVSLYLSIVTDEPIESTDLMGNPKIIDKGEVIFKKLYTEFERHTIVDPSGELPDQHPYGIDIQLNPSDLILENSASYKIQVSVSMNSGLSKTVEYDFTTELEEVEYLITAGITLDENTLSAGIIPSCRYDTDDPETELELVPNILMNVYRINFDNSFTKIGDSITNNGATLITDPHPAIRYIRYRIVCIDNVTGSLFYEDVINDGFEDITGIILQWAGKYQEFPFADEESIDTNVINSLAFGTMLQLPYNAKFSEDTDPDVELIDYIGKEASTSYYGTKKGRTASWSAEFDKEDNITLEKLRRLQAYMGDVYVRNQYGIGFWANVKVSFNEDYDSLVIPVSISITQVDSDQV